ncbi:MAG: hypothetical protein HFJ67_02880 [Adlercreutzia mucosicola]|nr:hypothetical protein [Adlercreutzia mucosicola]
MFAMQKFAVSRAFGKFPMREDAVSCDFASFCALETRETTNFRIAGGTFAYKASTKGRSAGKVG